ncbi:MAG: hypothetical protein HC880_03090 [Bacteroidia bacterium]|nr:hypothetical protein [Bacteroidia bacterium]
MSTTYIQQRKHRKQGLVGLFGFLSLLTALFMSASGKAYATAYTFSGMSISGGDIVNTGINFFSMLDPVIILVAGVSVGAFLVTLVIGLLRQIG